MDGTAATIYSGAAVSNQRTKPMKQRITLTIDPDTLREFDKLKTTKRQGRSGHVEELMTTAIHYNKVANAALKQSRKTNA